MLMNMSPRTIGGIFAGFVFLFAVYLILNTRDRASWGTGAGARAGVEGFRASKCYDCEVAEGGLGYPTPCFDCEAEMNCGRRPSGQSALQYQLGMGGGNPKMFVGA